MLMKNHRHFIHYVLFFEITEILSLLSNYMCFVSCRVFQMKITADSQQKKHFKTPAIFMRFDSQINWSDKLTPFQFIHCILS